MNHKPFGFSRNVTWTALALLGALGLLALAAACGGGAQATTASGAAATLPPVTLPPAATAGLADDPTAAPLLNAADLVYLGAFRVPSGDSQGCNWSTGEHCFTYGRVFAFNPLANTLYFGGHAWVGGAGEVSIPAALDLSATAAVLQDIADLADGVEVDPGESNGQGPFSALVYAGRLIVSGSTYYDADGTQVNTHGVSGFDFSVDDDFQGWYRFDPAVVANPRSIGGYMTLIPAEWQALLGAPALTGNCCLSIISNSSAGPAVTAFDPAQVGVVNPIPGETLLFYPLDHPLAAVDTQNNLFNLATHMGGVAFPTGTRSVLFFGRQGTGPYCYGTGDECNDPVDGSKGTHAYPYRHQVWAYDANDLLAVKQWLRQPWEVQPYAVWELTEMDDTGSAGISGMVFDPQRNRVYITEDYGDEPVVHVYQIETPPVVRLNGRPADRAIHLTWQVSAAVPLSATWQISYLGGPGSPPSPISGLDAELRAFSLSQLTNYIPYSLTLNAMLEAAPLLTATLRLAPTDRIMFLPLAER